MYSRPIRINDFLMMMTYTLVVFCLWKGNTMLALRPDAIQQMARQIRTSAQNGELAQGVAPQNKEHAAFAAAYPILYAKCCDPAFSLTNLDYLIEILKTCDPVPTMTNNAYPAAATAAEDGSLQRATRLVQDHLKKQFIDPLLEQATARK